MAEHGMRKEVSPWIAVVGILVTLAVVQFIYWRGLVGGPTSRPPGGGGGPGGGAASQEIVDLSGPVVSTVAGREQVGYRDGSLAGALFSGPAGAAVSRLGTIYVADSRNHCIREVTPEGQVRTIAGAPMAGDGDGPGTQARFSNPAGVAIAADGSLLISDTGNHRIRRIGGDGTVWTYAGSETPRDDLGQQTGGYRDGAAARAQFRFPVGLAADAAGTLYVADAGNGCVRRISPAGEVSTLVTTGTAMRAPTELALVGDRLWVADTGQGLMFVGPRDGPLAPWRPTRGDSPLRAPSGVAAAGGGLYVADSDQHCLFQLSAEGVSCIAGRVGAADHTDGRGLAAAFAFPAALATGPAGELYVADFGNNCIRRVGVNERTEEVR